MFCLYSGPVSNLSDQYGLDDEGILVRILERRTVHKEELS